MSERMLGVKLGERYELEALIGEGGFGAVYRARDRVIDREVAVKVLDNRFGSGTGLEGRFVREARILGRLNHPNVVHVLDFGSHDERMYLVMELVRGESLAGLMVDSFPLSRSRIVRIGDQILQVLGEAHRLGIVHRDLKPENVLVQTSREGEDLVKVLDFGIASFSETPATGKTLEGFFTGTPEYMSPEQCRDQPVDGRSDLYAFGCILYKALCGVVPFQAASPVDILMAHLFQEPQAPSQRMGGAVVSAGLERIALWCLAKVPSERPGSAEELRTELARVLKEGDGIPAHVRAAQVRALEAGPTPTDKREAEGPAIDARVVVVDPEIAAAGMAQVVESLRALGAGVTHVRGDTVPGWSEGEVVVLHALDPRLERLVQSARGGGVAFLICGDEDDLSLMARAAELGAAEYVPMPLNPLGLRRAVVRAGRRRRKG